MGTRVPGTRVHASAAGGCTSSPLSIPGRKSRPGGSIEVMGTLTLPDTCRPRAGLLLLSPHC